MDFLALVHIAMKIKSCVVCTLNGQHYLFFWEHETYFLRFHYFVANLQGSVIGCFKNLDLEV